MSNEKDNFWDFEKYFIPKRTITPPPKRDVLSINVDIDGKEQSKDNYEKIPPRDKTQIHKSSASKGRSYKKEKSLIKTVAITPWTGNVKIYEDFDRCVKEYYEMRKDETEYVPFSSVSPTYSIMTKSQFEYYLYWRACIRKKEIKECESSYIFLYLNELISSLDFISGEQVISEMIFIWKSYNEEYGFLDKYIFEYITDIALIYNIDLSFLQNDDYSKIYKSLLLPEIFISYDCSNLTFDYINDVISYSYKDNKYYKDNFEIFDSHMEIVALNAIRLLLSNEEYLSNQLQSHELKESFNGACVSPKNKNWISISYISLRRNLTVKQMIISTIKMCENYIRTYLGIKTKYSISPQPIECVCEYIKSYFDDQNITTKDVIKKEIEPEYMSYYEPKDKGVAEAYVAKDIEVNAWETAEILEQYSGETYIEENDNLNNTDVIENEEELNQEENEYVRFVKSLNETQREFLVSIINDKLDTYVKKNNIIKDDLIRQINDISYDITGDIIIEDDKIIIDYYDDIVAGLGDY